MKDRMSPLQQPFGKATSANDRWIFADNVMARRLAFASETISRIWTQSVEAYGTLPRYCVGQSKELRRTREPGILIGRLLPTLYSYTQNRAGVVAGTETLRLLISRWLWRQLHGRGIGTCYLAASSTHFLATEELVPPVEVIVKHALVGTPAHIYHGLFEHRDRHGRLFVKGERHEPYVRFDYRNPLMTPSGERLRDEQLPLSLADRLIDTAAATRTALKATETISERFNRVGLEVIDICYFIDQSGTVLCGEVSPDNMRIKSLSKGEDFDKDLWRKDRPAEEIVAQWSSLLTRLEADDASA